MNSLEFIDKLIKHTEAQLDKYPLSGKLLDPNYKHKEADIVYKYNKYYTEQLQTLQQIRSELEAWYVVSNPYNIIKFGDGILEIWYDTQEEENILKKALEVKENVD